MSYIDNPQFLIPFSTPDVGELRLRCGASQLQTPGLRRRWPRRAGAAQRRGGGRQGGLPRRGGSGGAVGHGTGPMGKSWDLSIYPWKIYGVEHKIGT